jgi:hypothetical protein
MQQHAKRESFEGERVQGVITATQSSKISCAASLVLNFAKLSLVPRT